jgi:hypothetical protein
VISLFDRSFRFFRTSDITAPHLELTILVEGCDLEDAENRQIYVRVPWSFDAWEFSILAWLDQTSLGKPFREALRKVGALVDDGGTGYQFYRIGAVEKWAGSCFNGLEMMVFYFIMHHLPHLCKVHSAVVSRDRQGLMLCGNRGSGKTVLSYALARRGFRFLADEYGLFAPASLQIFPFPRSFNFKPGALALFPELESIVEAECLINSFIGKTYTLGVEKLEAKVTGEPTRASFLLFLEGHQPGAIPQLTPLCASEAVELLQESRSVFVSAPLEHRSFTRTEATETLCNNARCFRVLSGDLDRTVDLIASLIR